jgi:hypothetical protein
MNGKATLLVVAGFSMVFLIIAKNLGDISTRAVDNSIEYYNSTTAHDMAVSAANIAASKIFFDNNWTTKYTKSFKGGTISTEVVKIDPVKNIRKIVATSTYEGITKKVEVTLAPSSFAKFAYMSEDEGDNPIYWMSEDTVWGPLHTQDDINVSGSPVFWGKVTTSGKLLKKPSDSTPKFYGGFEDGVSLTLPSNATEKVDTAAIIDGKVFSLNDDSKTKYEQFYLTFKEDSIIYRIVGQRKNSKGKWIDFDSSKTVLTYAIAPNGVIFADGLDIRLKGVVKGQYTVATNKSIWLDDDIIYKTDPAKNPNSTDLLGIVAENNVWITENSANNNNIKIQASIFAEKGGFGAENYDDRPVSGSIYLTGGISQHERYPVGTFSGSTIKHGFAKKYRYDDRLAVALPPFYPGTGKFEVVSWYE